MKKLKLFIVITLVLKCLSTHSQVGNFKVRDDGAIQLGYSKYNYLTFGAETQFSQNNGKWAMEYWDNGLNFWKPYPTPGSGNYFLFLRDDGNIGIGTNGSPSYKLLVNGPMYAIGYYNGSDARLKKNISSIDKSKDKILKLKGVTYDVVTKLADTSSSAAKSVSEVKQKTDLAGKNKVTEYEKGIGFIAQDLQKVFPELVKSDQNGYLSVNYIGLIPVLVEALREQQQEIDQLKSEIKSYNNQSRIGETELAKIGTLGILYQNYPNPFTSSTTISYNIFNTFSSAQIIVYDVNGNIKKSVNITEGGKGSVVLEAGSIPAGTIYYSLLINGVVVDSKATVLLNK